MNNFQNLIISIILAVNIILFIKSYFETNRKNNAFGLSKGFSVFGAYVWGDGVVFGLFWILVSIFCLIFQQWILFWLIFAIFHAVRSLGETIYWFNEQFATKHRNKPEDLPYFKIFRNESVYFALQIYHQCVSVIAIVASIYFAHLWLTSL